MLHSSLNDYHGEKDDPVTVMPGNHVRHLKDFHATNFPLIFFPEALGLNGCTASYASGVSFVYVTVSISFDNTRERTTIRLMSVASLVELLRTSLQLLLASLWWHVWIAMQD